MIPIQGSSLELQPDGFPLTGADVWGGSASPPVVAIAICMSEHGDMALLLFWDRPKPRLISMLALPQILGHC